MSREGRPGVKDSAQSGDVCQNRVGSAVLLGIALAVGVGVWGCDRPEEPISFEQGEIFVYECNNGETLTVRVNEEMAIADFPEQPNIALLPIESEFGERYTDGTITLQRKGQIVSADVNGQRVFKSCKVAGDNAGGQDVLAELRQATSNDYPERCEVYRNGSVDPTLAEACHFAQSRGYIYIELADGTAYALQPTQDQTGVYLDAAGNEVYRQAGLGDRGHIYKLSQETVYVYWATAESNAAAATVALTKAENEATRYTPQTAITVLETGKIALQITDGDFVFDGILETDDNGFKGADENAIVVFAPDTGQIRVSTSDADEVLYEYTVSPVVLD